MLRFLTSGESHGPGLSAILEGLPAGIQLTLKMIDNELSRRQQGFGAGPRMKIERDRVKILSGVMEGKTTGAPLALWIENRDHLKWKGKKIAGFTVPRPGHADLVGAVKYGFSDLRPALERASARETAARVAVGAICKHFVAEFGITIGCYVQAIAGIEADLKGIPWGERIRLAEESDVRCPDPLASQAIHEKIQAVIQERNTLGGVLELVCLGVPPGLGSYAHWDKRLEARLGAAILSIPAIKGVEIGPAFENAKVLGTQAQDAILLHEDGDRLTRISARAGGIEGGVSNGEVILIRAAMKPIATTLTSQDSVDLATGETTKTHYERSDFCPVPRAAVILEAMAAYVLADAMIEKLGGDSIEEMKRRYQDLRVMRLSDLRLENTEHLFWEGEEND